MNYKTLLTSKEKANLFLLNLPWKFKKICPGYLRELENTCLKIIRRGGLIIPHKEKLEIHFQGNKYYLRVGSTDFLVFDQVIIEEEYKPIIDLIKQKNKSSGKLNIIDAGANVGFTSLYFSQAFDNSLIVGIEPDSKNFQALYSNIALNNKNENIKVMHAGIWGIDSELAINNSYSDGREWSLSLREVDRTETGYIKIKAYGLSTLMASHSIKVVDILKIDIEGGEKNLFDEWSKYPHIFKLIKFIAIEIHDELADRNFINLCLKQNGFEIFEIGETTFGENKNIA